MTLHRHNDLRFPHVLMSVRWRLSNALRRVGASCRRLRQGERIRLLHNRQGRTGLSGGPTLPLCFSSLGQPRRFLAAGLPVSLGRGRIRWGGGGRRGEMGHLSGHYSKHAIDKRNKRYKILQSKLKETKKLNQVTEEIETYKLDTANTEELKTSDNTISTLETSHSLLLQDYEELNVENSEFIKIIKDMEE